MRFGRIFWLSIARAVDPSAIPGGPTTQLWAKIAEETEGPHLQKSRLQDDQTNPTPEIVSSVAETHSQTDDVPQEETYDRRFVNAHEKRSGKEARVKTQVHPKRPSKDESNLSEIESAVEKVSVTSNGSIRQDAPDTSTATPAATAAPATEAGTTGANTTLAATAEPTTEAGTTGANTTTAATAVPTTEAATATPTTEAATTTTSGTDENITEGGRAALTTNGSTTGGSTTSGSTDANSAASTMKTPTTEKPQKDPSNAEDLDNKTFASLKRAAKSVRDALSSGGVVATREGTDITKSPEILPSPVPVPTLDPFPQDHYERDQAESLARAKLLVESRARTALAFSRKAKAEAAEAHDYYEKGFDLMAEKHSTSASTFARQAQEELAYAEQAAAELEWEQGQLDREQHVLKMQKQRDELQRQLLQKRLILQAKLDERNQDYAYKLKSEEMKLKNQKPTVYVNLRDERVPTGSAGMMGPGAATGANGIAPNLWDDWPAGTYPAIQGYGYSRQLISYCIAVIIAAIAVLLVLSSRTQPEKRDSETPLIDGEISDDE